MFFQAITGAQTPACLFAASDPVETVTPPPRVQQGLLTAVPIIALHLYRWRQGRFVSVERPGPSLAVAAHVFAQLFIDFGSLLNAVVEHGAPFFGVVIEIDGAQQEAGLENDLQGVAEVVREAANLFGLLLGDRFGLGRRSHE
jgi:hypothetical protein